MSQKKIAEQLKLITVTIGIFGIFIFAVYVRKLLADFTSGELGSALALLIITAFGCYCVLYNFWNVCIQIGRNNSFSHENRRAFSIMSALFFVLSVCWIISCVAYLIFWQSPDLFMVFKMFVISIVWLGISALCRALSRLIEKAREIREENDLTI